jgi:RNA polymerase sigma-70 factor (ECF subfamily)
MQSSRLTIADSYLKLFRKGNEEGFNYFFNTLYKPLHFFAIGYTQDKETAEDIIEDSFIKLWNKREIFETESGLKSYLYKTVHNACLRWLWQKQNRSRHNISYAKETTTTEHSYFENTVKAETINQLHQAIGQLPAQCKKVFTKLYIEGKSVSETAQEMDLTISTVKNQKARGIKLLKPKLSP